ncbi:RnfABCDGE type electron transport complex subunit D [Clostridium sp. B9]|uniref:RnfABCDGE type electron transport complex subunit D n=1 Tax=Clostridium sp. B9 TaxID=3423224 RepID=UPI003D2EB9D3
MIDTKKDNMELLLLENDSLLVTSSPHIKAKASTQSIMRDVLIALIPTSLVGALVFGLRAVLLIGVCALSAVLSEYAFQKLTKKSITISDLSAVVTGILLALNLPVNTPLWVACIGSIIAIILVKQIFGGIGCNFMNPALAARAFILAAWPETISIFSLDGVTTATPLSVLKAGEGNLPSLTDAFIGNIPGCIGEVSALAILIGAAYLFYKKIITWHIPVIYIGTVLILTTLIGRDGFFSGNGFYEIFTGGLFLGAFFMATDYTTSPMAKSGQIIFAFGCGLITTLIRIFGGYPEGVSYSILLMNLLVPVIDFYFKPKAFGHEK